MIAADEQRLPVAVGQRLQRPHARAQRARACALSAIVVSTASPSAPPSRREVLSRPDATPASAAGTPWTATIVEGTSASPRPAAASVPPGSTDR